MPAGPRFERLDDWLDWQQRLHPATIELGLRRISGVLARTGWTQPRVPVITVGGTNGKGSCVALLDAVLRASGYRVATFTSPHLVDYRERIRIDGAMVSEASLIAAFERAADALGPDSLTFFEFNTLAALLIFETAVPDVIVLEVGLGGRLDSVNVVDPDVAVVVSIGLDHMDWLGPDEESIGREKAGIFRAGRPAVFGTPEPPQSVRDSAREIGALLKVRGADFDGRTVGATDWDFMVDGRVELAALPLPSLAGPVQVANAATALMALHLLRDRLPLTREAIDRGLQSVRLPGRFQRDRRCARLRVGARRRPQPGRGGDAGGQPARAAGGRSDAGRLRHARRQGRARGRRRPARVRRPVVRGEPAETRGRSMPPNSSAGQGPQVSRCSRPARCPRPWQRAAAAARPGDRIVVFGSFHTVGPALAALRIPL